MSTSLARIATSSGVGQVGPPLLGSTSLRPLTGPDFLPSLEFGRPDPVPCEIALVQTQQLSFGNLTKPLAVFRIDVLLGPSGDPRGGSLLVHALTNDCPDDLTQRRAVLQPKRIGLAQGLPYRGVAGGGSPIGPNEHVAQQFDALHLVHAKDCFGIQFTRHVLEGQRCQIRLDQWDVRNEPRYPLVDIVERLQVGKLYHHEKGLFEWIADRGGGGENLTEAFFDHGRRNQGLKYRTLDFDGDIPEPPRRTRVCKQVVRQRCVEIEDRMSIEADGPCVVDQKLDGFLVVQDHLRFESLFSFCFLADFEQSNGIEQRIGVALEAARVPGQIDQQPVQDLPGVGTGGLVDDRRPAHFVEVLAFRLREIEGLVGPIRIQEATVVADRLAPRRRLPDILPDLGSCPRQGRQDSDPRTARGGPRDPAPGHADLPWQAVARPTARADHGEPLAVDERLQTVLQGPERRRRDQGVFDLRCRHALRVLPQDLFDCLKTLFLYVPCHLPHHSCA